MNPSKVTAVVAAGGESRLLAATLKSLRAQTSPPRDVVVAPRSARDAAVARASTPYVFLLNAGDDPFPECLERLSRALDNCDASFAYSYLRSGRGKRMELANLSLREGAMVLWRRSAWKKTGGWGAQVPEILGSCRAGPESSSRIRRPARYLRAARALLAEFGR